MTWLATLIADIATALIAALGKDIQDLIQNKQTETAAADAATQSAQALVDAKTGAEVDQATPSALNNL